MCLVTESVRRQKTQVLLDLIDAGRHSPERTGRKVKQHSLKDEQTGMRSHEDRKEFHMIVMSVRADPQGDPNFFPFFGARQFPDAFYEFLHCVFGRLFPDSAVNDDQFIGAQPEYVHHSAVCAEAADHGTVVEGKLHQFGVRADENGILLCEDVYGDSGSVEHDTRLSSGRGVVGMHRPVFREKCSIES